MQACVEPTLVACRTAGHDAAMLVCPREPGRAPGVVMNALVLVALLGSGCAQLLGIEDLPAIRDGGNEPAPDAGVSDAGLDPPDAGPGCEDGVLQPALRIDGTLVTEGQPGPVVEVLLGDLVTISAAGSCGGDGALSYEWAIMPDDGILATVAPALAEGPETFTLYPTIAGDYTVELTVRDSTGVSAGRSVLAIRAHAWQVAPVEPALNMGEVRDLAVGGGNLWIASLGGPFKLPLAGPPDAFARVDVNGSTVPTDLSAVFFDGGTNYLWFGRAVDEDGPWRLDTTVPPPQSVQITWDHLDALDDTAQAFDIASFEGTIIVATSKGITAKDPSDALFNGQTQPDGQNPTALAFGDGRQLAGSRLIYDLQSGQQFDSGAGGTDNRIRTMAIDESNQDLWVGTDSNGVASFDLRDNVPIAVYTATNSGLGSNIVRRVVVEAGGPYAGDVWAATDAGVSRFIRQRNAWIHMNDSHGLAGHLDLNTLVIDTDQGRRVIYGGSAAGVVYLRKP
jgi:frataxin-like iron-binding protein CyaY